MLKSFKPVVVFIFVITSMIAQAKAKLVITIDNCRETNGYTYLSKLMVLRNGEEFKLFKPEYQNELVLNSLEMGSYTLVYTSLFNEVISLIVEIEESKEYSATLCIDFIEYSKQEQKPIIDLLQNGESYTISFTSRGCFHSTSETLKINRLNNTYTISSDEKSKQLSSDDIEKIRRFELEVSRMSDGGCTTLDQYIIQYNEESILFLDGSCRWNGFQYLLSVLD